MADELYYQHGGRQHGPVSGAELKALAAAGKLLPDDLIRKDGMEKWVPARNVKGLFPLASAPTAAATARRDGDATAPGRGQAKEKVEDNDASAAKAVSSARTTTPALPVAATPARAVARTVPLPLPDEEDEGVSPPPRPGRLGRRAKLAVVGGVLLLIAVPLVGFMLARGGSDARTSSEGSSADRGAGAPTSRGTTSADDQGGSPVNSISAAQLVKEYDDCLQAHVQKELGGKVVSLVGEVDEVRTDSITLWGGLSPSRAGTGWFGDGKVFGYITPKNAQQFKGVAKGTQIALRGRFRSVSFTADVLHLDDCEVIASPVATLPLAKEVLLACKASRAALDQKYGGKVLEVTGTVKRIDKTFNDFPQVDLQSGTDKQEVVRCVFSLESKSAVARLRQGSKVKVRGTCVGIKPVSCVEFKDCVVVPSATAAPPVTRPNIEGDTPEDLLERLSVGLSKSDVINVFGRQSDGRAPLGQGEFWLYYVSSTEAIGISFDKQGRLLTAIKQDRK